MMKKALLAASVLVLAACSAPSEPQLNLAPQASTSSQMSVNGLALTLESRDLRTAQYVAVVDSGRQSVQPLHAKQNLRVTLEKAISTQLRSQGFNLTVDSESTLRLDILEAIVNVQHSIMSNEMNGKVQFQLVAETPKGKFVKRYTGKSKKTGSMSASATDMELVLNDLMTAVLADIAADEELLTYLKENVNA